MMRALIILAALLSPLEGAWAFRVLKEVENSVELSLAELDLPTSVTGSVTFRTCNTCRATSLRVSTATKYLIDDSELPLEEFMRIAEEILDSDAAERTFTGVYYDLASAQVTRVIVRRARQ